MRACGKYKCQPNEENQKAKDKEWDNYERVHDKWMWGRSRAIDGTDSASEEICGDIYLNPDPRLFGPVNKCDEGELPEE